MDQATHDMHIRAGTAYGKAATCGQKVDYRTEESADRSAAVMMRKGSKALEAYPCAFCQGWHIGRAMTEAERVQFSTPTP
jgi:hypothetical protein